MPYHGNAIEDAKKNVEKKVKEKKERKKTQKELFEKGSKKEKVLSEKDMEKLKKHSKMHRGGMSSKHIKNMKKFMKEGMSFSMAHKKAVAIDKK